ncbi:hypothetical protein VP01_6736g1, partial [Puccinia sorghi]
MHHPDLTAPAGATAETHSYRLAYVSSTTCNLILENLKMKRRLLRPWSKRRENPSLPPPLPWHLCHCPSIQTSFLQSQVPSFQLHVTHGTPQLGTISFLLLGTDSACRASEEKWNPHGWALIKLFQYNPEDKAASFWEANKWIATHLDELAPGVLEQYRQLLLKSELPSFAQIEYPSPYDPLD